MRKTHQKITKKRVKPGNSDKEKRYNSFVEHYLNNGGNATQAAVSAGYSVKASGQAGYRLLKVNEILEKINVVRQRSLGELEITTDRVIREVARMVFVDPRKFFRPDGSLKPIVELDDDCAACVSAMDVEEVFSGRGESRVQTGVLKKIKLWDKNSAAEKLMKHLGLFENDNRQTGEAAVRALVEAVGGRGANFDVKR